MNGRQAREAALLEAKQQLTGVGFELRGYYETLQLYLPPYAAELHTLKWSQAKEMLDNCIRVNARREELERKISIIEGA